MEAPCLQAALAQYCSVDRLPLWILAWLHKMQVDNRLILGPSTRRSLPTMLQSGMLARTVHPQHGTQQVFYSSSDPPGSFSNIARSEEHTSELQSRPHLVCRLL